MATLTTDTAEIIAGLTAKQAETLAIIAQGRTHKEIAAGLGISISAATQRIESLRHKFGGVSKQELGRIFRESEADDTSFSSGKINQVPEVLPFAASGLRHYSDSRLAMSDSSPVFKIDAPWSTAAETRLVPEVLDGDHAIMFRWAATVGIAAGLLVFMILLLTAAQVIGSL